MRIDRSSLRWQSQMHIVIDSWAHLTGRVSWVSPTEMEDRCTRATPLHFSGAYTGEFISQLIVPMSQIGLSAPSATLNGVSVHHCGCLTLTHGNADFHSVQNSSCPFSGVLEPLMFQIVQWGYECVLLLLLLLSLLFIISAVPSVYREPKIEQVPSSKSLQSNMCSQFNMSELIWVVSLIISCLWNVGKGLAWDFCLPPPRKKPHHIWIPKRT